ncbi:MAG: hypothetical protein IPK32_07280 [Verrucomicrobiaceae bacterium]|nr:hypothetical protein [Verrucomicrobiaceae bacterium]
MLDNLLTPANTFFIGLGLSGIFLVMSIFGHWKTKREFRRYKTHLRIGWSRCQTAPGQQ